MQTLTEDQMQDLRVELETAAREHARTRLVAKAAHGNLRQVRRRHRRAVTRSRLRRATPRIRAGAMYGFALSALIFFVLGAHLYCTHQPGSGDSFKGAGAAAAITAVLRRRPDDRTTGSVLNRSANR
ncbi:hypothetical protein ACFY8P_23660 [Streptomyces sp. NPDC012693]|uniref:hypothetical protein n=1 Tax=Streptomyces sp. NPDC012693 TaxID=3364844 RepID=UPI003683EE75